MTALDKARAEYRRTYDKLFVASQKANSAEECDAINAKLQAANARYEAAKAAATSA
jgi:lysozyme family protein